MNTVDFCYWLQGYFELSESNELTEKQVQMIKNHLDLVFLHEIDPAREKESNASKQELNEVHSQLLPNDPLVRC